MSSHSLGVMELEMPSWTVVSLNDAARCHMTSQFHLILSLNDAARNRLLSRVARDQLVGVSMMGYGVHVFDSSYTDHRYLS